MSNVIAVNTEGVQALQTLATSITEAIEQIKSQTSAVESAADENPEGLGPHKASLDSALEEISANVQQASDPASNVSDKLNEIAEAYNEIIENDRIAGAGSGK